MVLRCPFCKKDALITGLPYSECSTKCKENLRLVEVNRTIQAYWTETEGERTKVFTTYFDEFGNSTAGNKLEIEYELKGLFELEKK